MTELRKLNVRADDSPSVDAFGRWRTSDPRTLFDSKQIFDNGPLIWDDAEETGSGTTSTHSKNTASSTMGVALNTAGKRTRQTFMRFNYQPGKSQLVMCTFVLDKTGGGTGITRGVGYYDDNNGLFLRDNEGTYEMVRRTYVSGAAVDNAVVQSSWNIDTMDGSGASGITLDLTKTQILIIDFEWLGVGRARMGFVIDGKIYYAHEFLNANTLDVVYMSTPNLPIRYQIENDGTGAASTMEHICATVISEGGVDKIGVLRHYDTGAVTGLLAGQRHVLMSGRLRSGWLAANVDVENLSLLVTTNDTAHWDIVVAGSVASTHTFSALTDSAVEIAVGSAANTITGGIEIDGGYLAESLPTTLVVANALRLGSFIDGTAQEWHLVVTPISNNATIHASITWREYL